MENSSETKKPVSDEEKGQNSETSTQQGDKKASGGLSNKVVIIAALLIVLTVSGATVAIVSAINNSADQPLPPQPTVSSGIGYSSDASVILTQEELQAAYDRAQANANNGNIALLYKNNANSGDGINFSCYIVNSASNKYDMFLTIYADMEMTDRIFLSQLVPPGSGFNKITLEHALPKGDHTVYVALTQVNRDETTGEEFICGQVFHTMEFHVL